MQSAKNRSISQLCRCITALRYASGVQKVNSRDHIIFGAVSMTEKQKIYADILCDVNRRIIALLYAIYMTVSHKNFYALQCYCSGGIPGYAQIAVSLYSKHGNLGKLTLQAAHIEGAVPEVNRQIRAFF